MTNKKSLLLCLLLSIINKNSFADGLDDLKSALHLLNGVDPISAEFESSYTANSGKKKETKNHNWFC
jgi:hypothetical protein